MKRKIIKFGLFLFLLIISLNYLGTHINSNLSKSIGDVVDSYNGVEVYYNGGVSQTFGRHKSNDGYNIGIRYQCVEFVKRYYLEHFSHKMPDSYGNAKDFFDPKLKDGDYNKKRGLLQFSNSSKNKPEEGDLIVFSAWIFNRYGHVAIISKVENDTVEIIQQNPGPFGQSRESLKLTYINNKWKIEQSRVLGWLHINHY